MKEYPRGCDLASCHSEDLEGRRFVLAWSRYQELAASTAGWSEKNPFFFHVEITGNDHVGLVSAVEFDDKTGEASSLEIEHLAKLGGFALVAFLVIAEAVDAVKRRRKRDAQQPAKENRRH